MKSFLDTNVLAYAVDPRDPAKRDRARAVMAEAEAQGPVAISTQILLEFHAVLTGKLRMNAPQARALVQATSLRYEVITLNTDLILRALDLHIVQQLSHWDACVVIAAAAAGCRRILTEDLQHNALIEGVRIVNPFRG